MKTRRTDRAKTRLLLAIAITAIVVAVALFMQSKPNKALAEEAITTQTNVYVVSDDTENVIATYEFAMLNDADCSVRIMNKATATKAVVPAYGEIEGKRYKVTEIQNNGFMSASKLLRVSLPNTIKKIGNSAFANCSKLKRINLANVEEIGNSAFYRCANLSDILLPKSVKKVGSYILRNNNTQVRVRAEAAGVEWLSSWNSGNANTDVIYGSNYVQPLELEPLYDPIARSISPIGYSIAAGQPRNDDYYHTVYSFDDESIEQGDGVLFVPARYGDLDILQIATGAFDGAIFTQLIVEYSEKTLSIGDFAFSGTIGDSIVINRSIEYCDRESGEQTTGIFDRSEVQYVVLPNSITAISDYMFSDCRDLKNLFFITPNGNLTRSQAKTIVANMKSAEGVREGVVNISDNPNVSRIGDCAFSLDTTVAGESMIHELHLNENINYVGEGIVDGWNETTQKVFVHNTVEIENWHSNWRGDFSNVSYDSNFYTITFDLDGGTFVQDNAKNTKRVKFGAKIGGFPEVERQYYDFVCWQYSNTKFTAEMEYNVESDITLKAEWKRIQRGIKFVKGNGEDNATMNVDLGGPLPDIEKPIREGYTFQGYYGSSDNKDTAYYYHDMTHTYIMTEDVDITVYAHWMPNEYKVDLRRGYGDNDILYTIEGQKYGSPMQYAPNVQREYYVFDGYFDAMNGDGQRYYDADMNSKKSWDKASDCELYAHWIPIEYTITYDSNGGDSIGNNPATYNVESEFALNPATHSLWCFDSWMYGDKKVTSVKGLSGNIALKAAWTDIRLIRIMQPFNELRITDSKVYVVIETAFSNSCTIKVASSVNVVAINGNGRAYIMSVIIEDRTADFGLYLQDIGIVAPQGKYAIQMLSNYTLFLYSKSGVVIKGYSPLSGSGGAAIKCYKLVLAAIEGSAHSLLIYGGDGTDGLNGTNGGNGGDGGAGIIAEQVIISCDNVIIAGGVAGKGGNGIPMIGFKGYGGKGAYPVEGMDRRTKVYVTAEFTDVHLYKTENGKDGEGADSSLEPAFPDINPDIPDRPIVNPPIGGITPQSYVLPIIVA